MHFRVVEDFQNLLLGEFIYVFEVTFHLVVTEITLKNFSVALVDHALSLSLVVFKWTVVNLVKFRIV